MGPEGKPANDNHPEYTQEEIDQQLEELRKDINNVMDDTKEKDPE